MCKTVFLWDIDGTLLLTGGAGIKSFNRLFLELYNQTHIWQKLSPDGRTDDWIISELFAQRFNRRPDPAELARIAARYNELMAEEIPQSTNFRLMPKAPETLEWLTQKNVVHGLATGNYEPTAWAKLSHAGLKHHFHFGGFGSDATERLDLTRIALQRAHEHLKEAPARVVLVGDTVHDVTCGRAIGALTVAVCTGSTTRDRLESAGADFVLDDLTHFDAIADSLLP